MTSIKRDRTFTRPPAAESKGSSRNEGRGPLRLSTPDTSALEAEKKNITRAYEAEKVGIEILRRALRAPSLDEAKRFMQELERSASVLAKEASNPASRIDWSRLGALLSAKPGELEKARARFAQIDRLDLDFQELVRLLQKLPSNQKYAIGSLFRSEAAPEYQLRSKVLAQIEKVKTAVVAAGDCEATANFPHRQLEEIERGLVEDIEALLDRFGSDLKYEVAADSRSGFFGGGYGSGLGKYGPEKEPKPDMLPARKSLAKADVATVETAAASLASLLGDEALPARLSALAQKTGDNAPRFLERLSAFALLVDEALAGEPKYREDRSAYRARSARVPGAREAKAKETLHGALVALDEAADPTEALGRLLTDAFLQQIGIPIDEAKTWRPTPEAVAELLADEGFVPLRSMNAPRGSYDSSHGALITQVTREVTCALVEGRFWDWRRSLPASLEQLEGLSEAQKETWFGELSLTHPITSSEGKPIELVTSQARGAEMLWVTKVGGPSYGFDIGPNCVLALLTNARTDTIIVKDPRWPNVAARTFLRLVHDAKTNQPLLFIDSPNLDFPYPGNRTAVETAIVKHAIAKAKAMKLPLALSGRLASTIDAMKLKGASKDDKFLLKPSYVWEAASVFGIHDGVQKRPEICRATSVPFYPDLDACQ